MDENREEKTVSKELKPSAGVLLGLAALNSFGGALDAMKRWLPYESIRPALSKNVRHVFETPLEQLIKEFEP